MIQPVMKKLMKIREVASRLQVSPRTVYRLISSGDIRAVKVRGSTRVHPQTLEAYVRRATGGHHD
jgi:excisionase family DNA binding protein